MRFSVATLLPATALTAAILASSAVAEPLAVAPTEPSVLPAPQTTQTTADPRPLSSPTVLVKTASEAVAQEVASRHGLTLNRAFPAIGWYELSTPPGTTDAGAAKAELDKDADVAETDAISRNEDVSLASYTPRDPSFDLNYNLPSGEQAAWNLSRANFPAAWSSTTGRGVSIGIIDSEFDTTHPELATKILDPYNAANGTPGFGGRNVRAADGSPSQVLHGTHVAGIAAGTGDNGIGIAGAAFDSTLVPVRINTSFTAGGGNPIDAQFVGDLTQALMYMASEPVSVVNMSLGTTRNHPPLSDAIQALRAKGVTVVAAAGNFQDTTDAYAPIYPAAYPGVIAVANAQSNDTIAPSSSNGAWVDIAAPGTNILSTWDQRYGGQALGGGTYAIASGTSMAAPMVAGLVALMKSVRSDLSPDEVEALLKGSARDIGAQGVDIQSGSGMINAAAAINAAVGYVRPAPAAPPAPPVTAQAPPPAPRDTVAPKVTVAGLVTVAGRSVAVRIKCDEGCNGTVRLRNASRRLLASKLFGAGPGKTITVRLKTKKRLKPRAKVFIEVAAKDASGNLSTKVQRRRVRR